MQTRTTPLVRLRGALLAVALLPLSGWAAVFRCEVHGSGPASETVVQYQATPCNGGQEVHTTDNRTAAQQVAARNAAASDAKLARKLEKSRRAEEKKASAQVPASIDTIPKPMETSSTPAGQTYKPRRGKHFTAVIPKASAASKQP